MYALTLASPQAEQPLANSLRVPCLPTKAHTGAYSRVHTWGRGSGQPWRSSAPVGCSLEAPAHAVNTALASKRKKGLDMSRGLLDCARIGLLVSCL